MMKFGSLHNDAKNRMSNGQRHPHSKDSQLLRKFKECFFISLGDHLTLIQDLFV